MHDSIISQRSSGTAVPATQEEYTLPSHMGSIVSSREEVLEDVEVPERWRQQSCEADRA
jgi:hypothetical protein